MLLTLVAAVGLLGVPFKARSGVLGRQRSYGLWLLGVAWVDALVTVVPLLVEGGLFLGWGLGFEHDVWLGWGPGLTAWVGAAGVGCFPLTIVVLGVPFYTDTLGVYYVQVALPGVVLGEWVSPSLGLGSLAALAWLTAVVLPVVVTMDVLVAVGAFALVVVVDWVGLRGKPQTSKGAVSPVAVGPGAPP